MSTSLLGTRIGHLRFVDVIGKGGMGEVYVGWDERLERKVALKSIRAEHRLDAESRARFLREARVLSQLAHPGICQIFDYVQGDEADVLVLELVQGRKLSVALQEGLDARRKLSLAADLAEALVAAHGKGVVHRDLKPDNVMVTDEGRAKVLDFGLSRSLAADETADLGVEGTADARGPAAATAGPEPDGRDGGASLFQTRLGSVVGTLGYMSPEQAQGEAATAASDVYTLGLVFQELFSGERAFDRGGALADRLERARRADSCPARGFDPDLVDLVNRMKSPAPAARPSAVDVAQRLAWVREKPRRRARRTLVVAAMAILAAFGVAMTVQTVRATRAERRAAEEARRASREAEASRQVSEFLVGLFRVSLPDQARGNTITAREILDQGAAKIEGDLADQPEIQARLLFTVGSVYWRLALYEQAEPLLKKALGIREKTLGPDHPDVAEVLHVLATVDLEAGRRAEAEALFRRCLAIREEALGPGHPDLASTLNNLGSFYSSEGRFAQAEPLFARALAIREKALGPDHPDVASSLNNLAGVFHDQQRYAEAEPLFVRTLAAKEKALGPDHPSLMSTLFNFARLRIAQGRHAEAEPLFRRSLAIAEKTFGPDHVAVGRVLGGLADLYVAQGRYDEAEPLLTRCLASREKAVGPDHPDVADDLRTIGELRAAQGRYGEAEPLVRRALAIAEKSLGAESPRTAVHVRSLAALRHGQDRHAEAERLYDRAAAILEKAGGQDLHQVLAERARELRELGRAAEAAGLEARIEALKGAPR